MTGEQVPQTSDAFRALAMSIDDFSKRCHRCGHQTKDKEAFRRLWSVAYDADYGEFPFCPECTEVQRRSASTRRPRGWPRRQWPLRPDDCGQAHRG